MISVGGVSLAIVILLLALTPPEDSRPHLARLPAPARGPLIDRNAHPEWRQFLIHAALRRADALQELRGLPDTRVPVAPVIAEPLSPIPQSGSATAPAEQPAETVAALPAGPSGSEPEDITGSITDSTEDGGIPIDIGETSSTELPVTPPEETTPVIRIPQREKPHESRKPRTRTRQARSAAKPGTPAQLNLLEALLELFKAKPDNAGAKQAISAN